MDQRLLLAIALSMAVIVVYSYFFRPPPPEPTGGKQAAATVETRTGEASREQAAVAPSHEGTEAAGEITAEPSAEPALTQPEEARLVHVDTPRYKAVIDTQGGRLISLTLKRYTVDKSSTNWGDIIPVLKPYFDGSAPNANEPVQMVKRDLRGAEPLRVRFADDARLTRAFDKAVYAADHDRLTLTDTSEAAVELTLTGTGPDGMMVRKVLTFHPDSYIIDYRLQVINYGEQQRPVRVVSLFGDGPKGGKTELTRATFDGAVYSEDGSVDSETPDDMEGELVVRQPDWVGMASTYFLTAARAERQISHAFYDASRVPGTGEDDEKWGALYGMELPQVTLAPERMVTGAFKLYMGPKKVEELHKFGHGLENSLDLTLEWLSGPLLKMLRWFHGYVGNFGVAIIMLTIVVRAALFPLTYRAMLSMRRMQKLQPKVKALREKYKGDKERQNREMMGMYKKYKLNPLGGCLPIALQLPIFFALYTALLGAIELRHEPFMLWIQDLSAHDPLYITPILMGVTLFLQQKLSPTALDPTQQKIMMFLPLVFMVFIVNFPAGLVLYWLTSNVLSILQQYIINRAKVPDLEEQPA